MPANESTRTPHDVRYHDWRDDVPTFETAVIKSFSFLEEEYGYDRRAGEARDFTDFRDAHFVVPYYGPKVAVEVMFDLAGTRVGVAFYELVNGRRPERISFYDDEGLGRAIVLDTFVSIASDGAVGPILPERSPRKPRIGEYRAADIRAAALRTNMGGVVAGLAERVKTWCVAILKGDTSLFPAIQKAHRAKIQAQLERR